MGQLVILRFEDGGFDQGFTARLLVGEEGDNVVGALPPNLKLKELDKYWQAGNLVSNSPVRKKQYKTSKATSSKINRETNQYAQNLQDYLNQWLDSDSFYPIREKLLETLLHLEEVRIIVQTENPQLWQIPWHCWNLFEPYPNVDVALSFSSFKLIKRRTLAELRSKVRVLAILGNSKGINVETDEQMLRKLLPEDRVEVEFLSQPKRRELYDKLWDAQGWDILFFAGHSQTVWYQDQAGELEINENDSLSIPELRHALKSAIALGLKLAIFNSCDGLGLARNLADLQIPQVIVMRKPIPDSVAQVFVEDFLKYFVNEGKSLYAAVRQARESLRNKEDEHPYASWLPVICQNSADEPIVWQGLLGGLTTDTDWQGCCCTLLTLDALKRLQSNMLTQDKGMEIEDIYIPPNLGLLERPNPNERKNQTQSPIPTEDYKITHNYQQHEFFEEVIRRRRSPNSRGSRLAIIGEPGTGKTLLLQRIGDWITWELDNAQQVVIWVSLADLDRGHNLDDYLQRVWLPRVTEQVKISWASPEALVQLFMTGKVWLLLDGADEMNVRSGNPLAEIAHQISESPWLTQARVVLTCRLNTWEANKNILQHFDVYRNLDFTYGERSSKVPDQVAAFIRRWFADDVAKGERLRQEIEQEGNQRTKELATNPLRLSLLCLVWEMQQGSLPDTRAALYEQFVQAIYKWKEDRFRKEEGLIAWANDRLVLNKGNIKELNKKLATLARRALEQKQPGWVKQESFQLLERNQTPLVKKLLPTMAKIRLEPQDSPFRISHALASSVLHSDLDLALQLGWLNQVGMSRYHSKKPIYAFSHPTFHEYFAAKSINDNEWRYFLNHSTSLHPGYGTYRVFEPQWREVILLWFGREDVLDVFKQIAIKALWSFQDKCWKFYRFKAKFLATAALAEFKTCKKDIAIKIVEEVGKSSFIYFNNENYSSFPYEAERERASKALEQTNFELAKDFLTDLISKISGKDRICPAFALEAISPGHPLVVDTFLEDFKLTGTDASDLLDRLYAREALILTAKGNANAIKTLLPLLENAKDEEMRIFTARILGIIAREARVPGATKLVAEKAVDTLIKHLRESFDREQVLDMHEYFEAIGLENPAVTEYIFKKLTNFLEDTQTKENNCEEKRLCAASALLKISSVNQLAVNVLLEISYANEMIGEVALEVLEKLGNNNSTVINALCKSISELNEEELTDNSDRVSWKIIGILGKIAFGNQVAIDTLSQRIDLTRSVWRRLQIADKLEQIEPGNEKAIATLQELMRSSENEAVRASAAQHLAEVADLDSSEAIDILILLQQAAYREVLEFVQQSGLNVKTMGDSIRHLVSESCKASGDSSRTEFLRQFLQKLELVANIVNRLSKIGRGNRKVISALTLLVETTPDEEVRFKAVESLGSIAPGSPVVVDALMGWYRNAGKEDRRQRAVRELVNQIWDVEVSDRTCRQLIVQSLSEIIQSCQDDQLRLNTAKALGKFDSGNSLATATLVDLVKHGQGFHFSHPIAALKDIIQGSQAQKVAMEVVTSLKELLNETYENQTTGDNGDQFEELLKLFWFCSEFLSYPDFYRAWNNEPEKSHLQPKFITGKLVYSVVLSLFKLKHYILHPVDLLFKIIKFIFQLLQILFCLTCVCLIFACSPVIFAGNLISRLSRRYLGFDIVTTSVNLLAKAVSITFRIILILLVFGLPIYLIYRLLAWIFGW